MNKPCLELTKIWEDTDFFEIHMLAHSPHCQVNIDFYTTNNELEELRKGISLLSKNEEFVWKSGADSNNVTHYIYFRFFTCSKRGHIAIEVLVDTKLDFPFNSRANFYIITELGSLDDFVCELNKLIMGIESSIKGITYSQP